jgi:hypothetical protein
MKDNLTELFKYIDKDPRTTQLDRLNAICMNIYIARNITLNQDDVITCLMQIDKLYRDENSN